MHPQSAVKSNGDVFRVRRPGLRPAFDGLFFWADTVRDGSFYPEVIHIFKNVIWEPSDKLILVRHYINTSMSHADKHPFCDMRNLCFYHSGFHSFMRRGRGK